MFCNKISAFVILALLAVCATAEPIRQRPSARRQPSARQQLAPTAAPSAATGYAPAGVTPKIPFDLPTETEQPEVVFTDNVTDQPDQVYGPPDVLYGPPENVAQPDGLYGPPESTTVFSNPEIIEIVPDIADIDEDLDEVVVDEDGAVISVASTFEQPAGRLVFQRFPQRRQAPRSVPARLVGKPAKLVSTARSQKHQRTN